MPLIKIQNTKKLFREKFLGWIGVKCYVERNKIKFMNFSRIKAYECYYFYLQFYLFVYPIKPRQQRSDAVLIEAIKRKRSARRWGFTGYDSHDNREKIARSLARSSKKYVFTSSVNIFPLLCARGYPVTLWRSVASWHNNGGLSDGRYHVTWRPRDYAVLSNFARSLNYSRRSIALPLPIDGVARRPTALNTARGKVELAGHVSRERNIAARFNGRGSVNRGLGDKQSRSKPG